MALSRSFDFRSPSMECPAYAGSLAIVANNYKTYSPIWRDELREKYLPYPVMENGKVSFARGEPPSPQSSSDAILKDLVAHFFDEYQTTNPVGEKLLFRVYTEHSTISLKKFELTSYK